MFPDVPTFDEMGLKGFDVAGWFGIAAPGGTPREIVRKLDAAVVAALEDPEVVRRPRTVGMEPTPTTPEEFTAFMESEMSKRQSSGLPVAGRLTARSRKHSFSECVRHASFDMERSYQF